MRYRVSGANQHTGAEISMTVDAPDEESAEAIAREKGILVSEVVAEQIPHGPDSDLVAMAEAARQGGPKPVVPMYESAKRPPERYRNITRGAAVLRVLSILAYVAAGLCIVIGIVTFLVNVAQSQSLSLATFVEWLPILAWVLMGLFYFAVGALLAGTTAPPAPSELRLLQYPKPAGLAFCARQI